MEEVMLDLLHSAAWLLREGGFLAYMIPTPYDFSPADLPRHPVLEVVTMCRQTLSTRHGRHLVVLRKTRAYSKEDREEFENYKKKVMLGEDGQGFGVLLKKLQLALSNDAFFDDRVVKKISSRCAKRKENKLKQLEKKKVVSNSTASIQQDG